MSSASRVASLERGLTSVARKVYEAVAIQEERNLVAITAELKRAGRQLNRDVIQGCLRSLVDQHLVKEGHSQQGIVWWRPTPKADTVQIARAAPPTAESLAPYHEEPETETAPDTFARLAKLATVLREVADEAEAIAIAAEEERAADRAQLEKFKQLKALLA